MPFSVDPKGAWGFDVGTWLDSSGNGHTLSQSGSVSCVAGKVGNCASFGGAGVLYSADHVDYNLMTTTDLSLPFWFWLNSKAADMTLISKGYPNSGGTPYSTLGWRIYYKQSTDRITIQVARNSGTEVFELSDIALGSPSTGTWIYYIPRILWSAAGTLGGSITVKSTDCVSNSVSTSSGNNWMPNTEAGPLTIGGEYNGVDYTTRRLDGKIDALYLFNVDLSDDDCNVAYNDGDGFEESNESGWLASLMRTRNLDDFTVQTYGAESVITFDGMSTGQMGIAGTGIADTDGLGPNDQAILRVRRDGDNANNGDGRRQTLVNVRLRVPVT